MRAKACKLAKHYCNRVWSQWTSRAECLCWLWPWQWCGKMVKITRHDITWYGVNTMYSIHKSDEMNMLTFMRWWCWCGWEVWVIGWQKENWFSHDNLSLYPRPCLADHNLDYHDDHADEGGGGGDFVGMEIWNWGWNTGFYNSIRLSCFCCLFVFILCFFQNGALVTSKRVASVDKSMWGYVIEKWPKLENWPN